MDLTGDWDYIEFVADQRRTLNQTPRHIPIEYLEVIGAAGELAARRLFGMPEDLHIHFDHGRDFVWKGISVDVKATILTPKLEFRYLQWPREKRVKANIILMVAVDEKSKQAVPVGYATKDEIIKAPINWERQEPCREIPTRDLHPVWELFSGHFRSRKENRIAVF